MAKKTTDYTVGDPGLDDFDNFDDFDDFDTLGGKKDDRKPVTRFASSFAEGAVKSVKSPSFFKNVLRNALPREYGEAMDDFEGALGKAGDLYNKTARSLEPSAAELRKIAKAMIPADAKWLPNSVKDWMNEKEIQKISEEAQRENDIDLELNAMFRANMAMDAKGRAEDRMRAAASHILTKRTSAQQLAVLNSIREGVSRQVGYQDAINAKWQRKTLELQYRQYYIQRDTLQEIKLQGAKSLEALQSVIKNTGLPDAVKLHAKEAMGVNLRERFINKVTDPAVRGFNGLVERLGTNLGNWVTEQAEFAKDGIDMLAMSAEMMSEMGIDGVSMAGEMAGGQAANWGGGLLGRLIGKRLSKSTRDKLQSGAYKLNKFKRNAGSRFYDWVEGVTEKRTIRKDKYGREIKGSKSGLKNFIGEQDDDISIEGQGGVKGWFKNFLYDIVGSRNKDNELAKDFGEYSQDPVAFNALARRSITEIIPGYLARILREMTVMRTGDINADTMVYNVHRGQFTPMSAKKAEVRDRIRRKGGTSYTATDLMDIMAKIDPSGHLSPEARETLKMELLRRSRDGKEFSPDALSEDVNYSSSVSGAMRAELSRFFAQRFKTDQPRKAGEGLDIDKDIDTIDRSYVDLSRRMLDIETEIQRQIENGNTEDLISLGLIRVDNEGRVLLNSDAVFNLILAEDEALRAAKTEAERDKAKFSYRGQSKGFKLHSSFKKLQEKPSNNFHRVIGEVSKRKDKVKGMGYSLYEQITDYIGSSLGIGTGVRTTLRGKADSWFGKARDKWNKLYQSEDMADFRQGVDSVKSGFAEFKREAKEGLGIEARVEVAKEHIKEAVAAENIDQVKAAVSSVLGSKAAESVVNAAHQTASKNNDTGSVGFKDELFSILNQQLNAQVNTTEALVAMNQQLIAGINVNHNHSGERKFGIRQGFRSLFGAGAAATGKVIRWSGSLYGQILRTTGAGLRGLTTVASTILGGTWKRVSAYATGVSDIYREDQRDKPLLFGKLMKQKRYLDVTTNKVVTKLADIKGPVKDTKTGEEVITAEDFKAGLVDTRGKPILKNISERLLGFYGAMYSPFGAAATFATRGIGALTSMMFDSPDIYVKGEDTPRLKGTILAKGGYRSGVTGKKLKRYRDIDGPVVDATGTVVIKAEEVTKLVDRSGKPVRTIADRIMDVGKTAMGAAIGAANFALKVGVGMYGFVGRILRGSFNFARRGLGLKAKPKTPQEATLAFAAETTEVLYQIRDILDTRLSGGRRKLGDKDGDGDVENSWQDRMAKRKEQAEAAANKAAEKGKDLFSGLSGTLKGIFGGAAASEASEASEGDTNIIGGDLGGGEGGDKDKNGKDGKKGPDGKPKGRWGRIKAGAGGMLDRLKGSKVGRLGGWLARAGVWAGRGLLMAGGIAALGGGSMLASAGSALLTGLVAVGSTIAAIVSSPVVLGALAVAAVGTAGYYGYKYLTRGNNGKLSEWRMLQYGFRKDQKEQSAKIFKIEDFLIDYVKFQGDEAALAVNKDAMVKVIMDMGISVDDTYSQEQFLAWFDGRFKPVFLKSIAALRNITQKVELADIDRELSKEEKLKYVELAKFPHNYDGPYGMFVNPFTQGKVDIDLSEIQTIEADILEENKADEPKTLTQKIGGMLAKVPLPVAQAAAAALGVKSTIDANNAKWTKYKAAPESTGKDHNSSMTSITANASITNNKFNLQPLDIVRMKAYGLVEMEVDKVKQLVNLEKAVLEEVFVTTDGNAEFKGAPQKYFDEHSAGFGVSTANMAGAAQWMEWFTNRFIPVFITYVSAVKQTSKTASVESVTTYLTLKLQIDIAMAVIDAKAKATWFNTSVWKIIDSPWPGYRLNNDSATALANVDVMKEQAKKTTYTDNAALAKARKPVNPVQLQGEAKTFLKKITNGLELTKKPESSDQAKKAPQPSTVMRLDATAGNIRKGMGSSEIKGLPEGYIVPAEGTVTSLFGPRDGRIHKGVDIGAATGTPIYAAQDGLVFVLGVRNGYGNVIYLNHNDGRQTRYAHLSRFQPGLKEGDYVRRGSIIGYVGNTGISRGAHLHFEIRENGEAIDPLRAIQRDPIGKKMVAEAEATQKEANEASPGAPGESPSNTLEGVNTLTMPKLAGQMQFAPGDVSNASAPTPNGPSIGDAMRKMATSTQMAYTPSAASAVSSNQESVAAIQNERKRAVAALEVAQVKNSGKLSAGMNELAGIMKEHLRVTVKMAEDISGIRTFVESAGTEKQSTESKEPPKTPVAKKAKQPYVGNTIKGPVSVAKGKV